MKNLVALLVFLFVVSSGLVTMAKSGTKKMSGMPGHMFFTGDNFKWMEAPAALPPGAKIAVLEGNPMAKGPFTMRVMLPANYRIPPHWHRSDEHVTVISGVFHIGMGSQFDETQGQELTAGSFAMMRPHVNHFAWTTEPTVIQLHGMGPWGINYVNPADDPRHKPSSY